MSCKSLMSFLDFISELNLVWLRQSETIYDQATSYPAGGLA